MKKIDFSKYYPSLCATGVCPICGAKMDKTVEKRTDPFRYKRTVYTCQNNKLHRAGICEYIGGNYMKKIPTLFKRVFEGHKIVGITPEVTEGCEDALTDKTVATIKYDGSCCAIIDGVFYKRYDAKKGKKPPEGAIPCCEPDPVTGHWPHWVAVDFMNPADKWFTAALNDYGLNPLKNFGIGTSTYEAIGKHFNGNPYGIDYDTLVPHGFVCASVDRSFHGIKTFLEQNIVEGLVFWKDGEPLCKIKRSDFGLPWGKKNEN